ncbi:DNA-binding transcriptional regulator, XRE-family HTH domain [Pseudarcicella hirudinis]|uniref:DNA-binding transcriptional regulator, XRE-family HTH domain n=1 Tax=Pseudarcicella hirudinis TaxID=1079859 RepID=A0A1I5UUR8_9BACT|nr:helix-turn-helix transcriptional regulator [Pseudarcicella hirudinis]SFP98962.1 DNA-binding transcriptional regulator, XRE-family HTH domain [Pseudarcicella hirudinis]
MSIVSNNIKYLRRLNGLTQEQFARRINIKRSLLGAYEEARANPNLENLKTIAQVFGTSVDSLIKTDIRKIRETPGINIGQTVGQIPSSVLSTTQPTFNGQTVQRINPPTQPSQNFIAEAEPKPIAHVIEKYLRNEEQVKLVAQPVVPKKVNRADGYRGFVTVQNLTKPIEFPQVNNQHHDLLPEIKSSYSFGIVKRNLTSEYLLKYQKPEFLSALPQGNLPNLFAGKYRAFEVGEDFSFPGALVVGKHIADVTSVLDGRHYILILQNQGIIYRRVYNQAKIKGVLLLSSDNQSIPSFEVSLKDVLEIWEVKAFISEQLPEPQLSLEKIKGLVDELQNELSRR